MYLIGQIFASTEFIRNFSKIIRVMDQYPQHLLITTKNCRKFVFVNAEIFDELFQNTFTPEQMGSVVPSVREIVLREKA